MNLREQEYVLAIARHKSIKGASDELFISQPSLSFFLSTLEKRLETPLFNRLGKKFVPTETGRLYIECAEKMVQLKQNYLLSLHNLKNNISGTVNLGIHAKRTSHLIPSVLHRFSQEYPGVDVNIVQESSTNLFKLLLSGELDIIINNQRNPHPALCYTHFYDDYLLLVLSPDHPLAGKGQILPDKEFPWIDLSDFSGETFILQYPGQASRHFSDIVLSAAGVTPGKAYFIENLETASQMAAEGLGASFTMYYYAKHFHYPKPVCYYFVGDPPLQAEYSIVRREDVRMEPYTQRFMVLLQEYADSLSQLSSVHTI